MNNSILGWSRGRMSQSRYRILHLISSMRWTGVAEPAASLCIFQIQDGHSVEAAAIWERSLEANLAKRNIPLARNLDISRHINPYSTLRSIVNLRAHLARQNTDIVHCHLIHDHWLAAMAIRRMPKAKRPRLVRTVHRYERMRKDPWHKWLFQVATDQVHTVSSEQQGLVEEAYQLKRPVELIFGGVDARRFSPENDGAVVRADMGESVTNRVAGIVAHLGYNRGHRWLLDAVPELLHAVPEAVIWIVGKGELASELRMLLKDPKFEGRVQMAGYRTDDLPQTYAACDAGILLGLGSEGSARAAMEFMATGKPVVAVEKGSLKDLIKPGVHGYLVPDNDTPALSKALIDTLADIEKCRAMGTAARQQILENFTEDRRAVKTMEAYNKLFTPVA